MTLEAFFEKFNLFADAPNAVAKMRDLVLSLAVQGKLVDQISSDEPADKLLARLGLKSTVAKNSNAEIEGDSLPPAWARVRFEDIALVAGGVTLGRKLGERKTITLPYLRVANVKRGEIDLSVVKEVSIAEDEMDRYALRENDLLMTEGGDWDKVGRAAIWRAEIPVCLHQNHVFRARMRSAELTPFWFERYFNSRIGRSYFEASSKQTTNLASINMRQVRNCPIPLPPLAEQKRIVAKVDELMALCDRLETQQQEREAQHAVLARAALARFAGAPTPANLDFIFHKSYPISPADLRKSILTLAVQGRVVPQDPNDEPVEELLKRSLSERRKLRRAEATEVRTITNEGGWGYDIPESWRWQSLDDLLVFGPTNGFSPKAVDYETSVRSLTLSATTSGQFKGQHSKFITTEVPADSDLWLRDGDILVQRGNTIEYVGVAAVYRGEPNCFVYPDLMMKLRVSSEFDVGYIHLAMSHAVSRDFLRARASGTSGSMPKINQTTLKSLPLPIPPLAEQRRIVAKVDQLMTLVDALETQLAASRAAAANLLSALVAELTAA